MLNNERKFSLGRRPKRKLDPATGPILGNEIPSSQEELNSPHSNFSSSQKEIEETILKEEREVQEKWSNENPGLTKVKGWQINTASTRDPTLSLTSTTPFPDFLDTLEEVQDTSSQVTQQKTSVSMQAFKALMSHDPWTHSCSSSSSSSASSFSNEPPMDFTSSCFNLPSHFSLLRTQGLVSKSLVLQEQDVPWKFNEVLSEIMKKNGEEGFLAGL